MIYQILIRLLAPLILFLIVWDAFKRKGGGVYIAQRLGFVYSPIKTQSTWIHCASVGEVRAIEPLVKSSPNTKWLITTNTPTGFRTAQKANLPNTELCYCPFDWPFAVNHFLRSYQPSTLWVVETELWPNLYRLVSKNNIKITIINGRISKKTLNTPPWLREQYRDCLKCVDRILARSDTEKTHFITLGAPAENIEVLGNIKYSFLRHLPAYTRPIEKDYILLASSHQNEEFEIARRWLQLKRPEILVIVPRHAKRGASIRKQLAVLDKNIALASDNTHDPSNSIIFIDDSFGRLMNWYAHAELVIMGGSFTPKGGHNFLEPAALSKAIFTGPDNTDFLDDIIIFINNDAIIICSDYESLIKKLSLVMVNLSLRISLGEKARDTVQEQPDVLAIYRYALNITS